MRRTSVGSAAAGGALFLAIAACSGESGGGVESDLLADCRREIEAAQDGYWVCAIGDRGEMLRAGDLSGRIALSELPPSSNLVGVGPIEGLQGEITIDQGTVYRSVMEDGRQVIEKGAEGKAVFLAFGAADEWRRIDISEPLAGFDAIEAFIADAAADASIDPDRSFPFRIAGAPPRLKYHVIFKSDHGGHKPHGPEAHKKAKIPFEAHGAPASIVGLWADPQSVGQYTHKGRRTHMHVVLADKSGSGHVDDVTLSAGMTLELPKVSER